MGLTEELAGYDGRAVANLVLAEYDSLRWDISNKKINKLIFQVYGVALARMEKKLIRNYFEAWEHGPVIRVVYEAFKLYGFSPILQPATHFDIFEQVEKVVPVDNISASDREFILKVVSSYIAYSADELEEMTHQPGGPWDRVRLARMTEPKYQNRIPDLLIREYFVAQLGEAGRLN